MLGDIGKISIGHEYQQKLAEIILGAYVREHEKPAHYEVRKNNKRIEISELLIHKDKWKELIKATQQKILESLSS